MTGEPLSFLVPSTVAALGTSAAAATSPHTGESYVDVWTQLMQVIRMTAPSRPGNLTSVPTAWGDADCTERHSPALAQSLCRIPRIMRQIHITLSSFHHCACCAISTATHSLSSIQTKQPGMLTNVHICRHVHMSWNGGEPFCSAWPPLVSRRGSWLAERAQNSFRHSASCSL